MKPSIYRRIRRRTASNEAVNSKKENKQESSFFGEAASEHFFQPAPVITQPSAINRKCEECEQEDKKVQRAEDKKEEDKKLQRMTDKKEEEKVQRQPEKKEEEKIQKKEAGNPTSAPVTSSYISSLNSKGTPLPKQAQQFFGSRMGYDFSNVKVHTDQEAAQSAKEVNAKAYTTGAHIVFNEGQFNTESTDGKKLMAHELVHIVQQNENRNGVISRKPITCKQRYKNLTDAVHDKKNFENGLTTNIDSWTPYIIDKISPLVDDLFDTEDKISWLGKLGDLALSIATDLTEKALGIITLNVTTALIAVCREVMESSGKSVLAEKKKLIKDATVKSLVQYKDAELKRGKQYIDTKFTELKKNDIDPCYMQTQKMFSSLDQEFPRVSEENFAKVSEVAEELLDKVMFLKNAIEIYKSTGLLPSEYREKQYNDCKRQYLPAHGMPSAEQDSAASEKCYYLTFPLKHEAEGDRIIKQMK